MLRGRESQSRLPVCFGCRSFCASQEKEIIESFCSSWKNLVAGNNVLTSLILNTTLLTYQKKKNFFDLAVWGVCNHAFHLHCILKWVNSQTSQAHCPMCRREWQFKG